MLDKFRDAFREEASELLVQLEETLLEMEQSPQDMELLNTAFRAVHTIKGSSGMFGFDSIASFAHKFENLMDECRSGKLLIEKGIIDFSLAAKDHLRLLLDADGLPNVDLNEAGDRLLERISGLESKTPVVGEKGAAAGSSVDGIEGAAEARKSEHPASGSGGGNARSENVVQVREAFAPRSEAAPEMPEEGQNADPAGIMDGAGKGGDTGTDGQVRGKGALNITLVKDERDRDERDKILRETVQPEFKQGTRTTCRIVFKPDRGIFLNGTKILHLMEELCDLGQATVTPHLEDLPPLSAIACETCYCWWEVLLTTDRGMNAIRDVFVFVEDSSDLAIEPLGDEDLDALRQKKLGQILVDKGYASTHSIEGALKTQRRIGEVLVEKKIVTQGQIASALAEQDHLRKVEERRTDISSASIRVASEKLDALVDLVGELVTLQARLSQTIHTDDAGMLASIAEQFERIIGQLRDNAMSIRMMPIGTSFNRYKRVVRDLSGELGKEVRFQTEGGETELDKTVIEKLTDPLVHLIRNSLDHGIESPDARVKAGKPREGTITLSAMHSGTYVLISVSDDGNGLDREAILRKGIERGLVQQGQEMGDQETYSLIMLPGFSTAQTVTTVSGRGVGMDVVKREIETLGGSVEIRTERGRGLSIMLKIPLTLAIIDGLLIRSGAEFFVIPLAAVDGCVEVVHGESDVEGQLIRYRDEFVPILDLRENFSIEGARPAIEQIVIANVQESKVGILVDAVVGNFQTVIKPLGRVYAGIEGLSGATILGDGTVALILDVYRLSANVVAESARAKGKRE